MTQKILKIFVEIKSFGVKHIFKLGKKFIDEKNKFLLIQFWCTTYSHGTIYVNLFYDKIVSSNSGVNILDQDKKRKYIYILRKKRDGKRYRYSYDDSKHEVRCLEGILYPLGHYDSIDNVYRNKGCDVIYR